LDPPGVLLQVMPWPPFGKKTDGDLRAIYEYLRAIPSLPDNPNPGPKQQQLPVRRHALVKVERRASDRSSGPRSRGLPAALRRSCG
jgi:hypothetical protein